MLAAEALRRVRNLTLAFCSAAGILAVSSTSGGEENMDEGEGGVGGERPSGFSFSAESDATVDAMEAVSSCGD